MYYDKYIFVYINTEDYVLLAYVLLNNNINDEVDKI